MPDWTMNKLVTSRTVQRHLIRAFMREYQLSWMKAARRVLSFTVASSWIEKAAPKGRSYVA